MAAMFRWDEHCSHFSNLWNILGERFPKLISSERAHIMAVSQVAIVDAAVTPTEYPPRAVTATVRTPKR